MRLPLFAVIHMCANGGLMPSSQLRKSSSKAATFIINNLDKQVGAVLKVKLPLEAKFQCIVGYQVGLDLGSPHLL